MDRLAADENFNNNIVRGLIRRKPGVDIVRVQDVGLAGADDPSVLEWAVQQGRLLVSHDVSTLTKHAYDRVGAGLRMAGVFEVPSTLNIGRAIEDLLVIVECSLEGEWEGQVLRGMLQASHGRTRSPGRPTVSWADGQQVDSGVVMCWPIVGSIRRPHVLIAIIMLSTMVVSPAARQSGSSDEPIRKLTEHFLTVFQNLDWDEFRVIWSEDPSVFFPFDDTPERVTGKAAVEARWRRFFAELRRPGRVPPYFRVTPRHLLVQRYGDAAIVTFDLGEPPNPRRGRRTLIFVKEREAWKLAHLHASAAGLP